MEQFKWHARHVCPKVFCPFSPGCLPSHSVLCLGFGAPSSPPIPITLEMALPNSTDTSETLIDDQGPTLRNSYVGNWTHYYDGNTTKWHSGTYTFTSKPGDSLSFSFSGQFFCPVYMYTLHGDFCLHFLYVFGFCLADFITRFWPCIRVHLTLDPLSVIPHSKSWPIPSSGLVGICQNFYWASRSSATYSLHSRR